MEIPDIAKTITNGDVTINIHLPTEIEFARNLYQKLVLSLSGDDIPPSVEAWLNPENGDQLKENWESFKVSVIAQIESQRTSDEQKKAMCDLLETDLCIYMDLMASTWENFREHFMYLIKPSDLR